MTITITRLLLTPIILHASVDSTSTPVASELARGNMEEEVVDKRQNAWTTTRKFKRELRQLAEGRTVMELGAHVGYSTEVLASVAKLVFACEMSEEVLMQNMERTSGFSNILYFLFHSVFDDWVKRLPRNRIDFAFLDAAHDKASVLQDLYRLHELGIPIVALDDYGAERGVFQAVGEFVRDGKAKVRSFIGESPPWTFSDRTIYEHEGIILDMLYPCSRGRGEGSTMTTQESMSGCTTDEKKVENGTRKLQPIGGWFHYPVGVFLSGDFSPLAKMQLHPDGAGSYQEIGNRNLTLNWRPWTKEEEVYHRGRGFIVAVGNGPRFAIRFNGLQTGGIAQFDDGRKHVLVRSDFIRTLGETILSALF